MDFNIRKNSIKIFLVSCTVLVLGSIFAGTQQEAFLQAHRCYQEGNISKALELYTSMPHKGMAVLYNIGNCYYMQKNYPMAVLYWQRAQKEASLSEYKILESYIQQAHIDAGIPYNITALKRLYNIFMHLTTSISLLVWQILLLICWALLWTKSASWLYGRRYSVLILIIILFVFLSCISISYYRDQKYPKGIVTKNSISVYAGPGIDYAVLGSAKVFDSMRVYRLNAGWYLIYMSDLGYGWVSEKDFVII